jgi:hypothetical protein
MTDDVDGRDFIGGHKTLFGVMFVKPVRFPGKK